MPHPVREGSRAQPVQLLLLGQVRGAGEVARGDERTRAIFEIAVGMDQLDQPEILWKAYIDFETEEGERGRCRALYERLLERTQHVKVWISFAQFELRAMALNNDDDDDDEETEEPEAAAARRAAAEEAAAAADPEEAEPRRVERARGGVRARSDR